MRLIGAEAAGEGIDTGRHGAPLTVGGRGGVLHGAYSAIMQDEDGQILEAHSISAGLDYPGTGPEHAWLRDSGRARYEGVTDAEALAAFQRLAELEGIIPALESAHAVAWVLGAGRETATAETVDLICLSGRGDKDLAEALGQARPRMSAIAPRSRRPRGRAALMPYLMGGFPDIETSVRGGGRLRGGGSRPRRARRAVLGPARRWPGDPRGGHQALENGANVHQVLEADPHRRAPPGRVMCYVNPIYARGPERFAAELAQRGISGLIVPDLPLEESAPFLAACDAHGVALVPLVAPTTPDDRLEAIGRIARGFVYTVSVTGTTGERAAGGDAPRRSWRA